MQELHRRQRRPPVSCTFCRKRKVRCDRKTPCNTCLRVKNQPCTYEDHPTPSSGRQQSHGPATNLRPANTPANTNSPLPNEQPSNRSRSLASGNLPAPSPPSTLSPSTASLHNRQLPDLELNRLNMKIRQLEDQLSQLTQKADQVPRQNDDSHLENLEVLTSGSTSAYTMHEESRLLGQASIIRHIMYKTRLFGRSHWMNGAIQFKDAFEIMGYFMKEEMSKPKSNLQRCKQLAKIIKLQRSPLWPLTPTPDLPPKEIVDNLIDCYLRTSEAIYRVIHIPTFKEKYDAIWILGNKPDLAFIMQLKTIIAIGATIYDEHFSLRTSAIRWVHETQAWLSEPNFKSRLSLESLQTSILLLIAREKVAVGEELIWISAGSLLRWAVHMGLHRDPAHLTDMTVLAAEMRRRLWNTILEINLQSTLDSGGPPFISLDDFDTAPPHNFDDDQLMVNDAVSKPEDVFTQTSIAICLRKTFPIRLQITKFLNGLRSDSSYEETLRLDTELRASYKMVYQVFRKYIPDSEPSTRFATCLIDMIMCRYLSSLHIPFLVSSMHEPAYTFSRKVVIETALKAWNTITPSSFIMASPSRTDPTLTYQDDLLRVVICGTGFFRTHLFQACYLIASELRSQLRENEGLSPAPLRPDLLAVLNEAKTLMLRCMEAGETNIKNYLLVCVATAQIDGLRRGLPKEAFPPLLITAAEDAGATCLSILESKAAELPQDDSPNADRFHQMSANTPDDFMDGWDFMISDPQFDFSYIEPLFS